MEEAIKFKVEDKDGNAMMAEVVLNDTKEVVELRKVFKRALDMWETTTIKA